MKDKAVETWIARLMAAIIIFLLIYCRTLQKDLDESKRWARIQQSIIERNIELNHLLEEKIQTTEVSLPSKNAHNAPQ